MIEFVCTPLHVRIALRDNPNFEQRVGQIYPTELQLNKANSSDTEAPFLDLNLPITNRRFSAIVFYLPLHKF